MLESFPVCALLGTLLGFLSGLGTGGGSLLILWLTMVVNLDPGIARTINLMFFLPSAFISTGIRIRQRKIPFRKILLPAAVGCVSAVVFSLIGKNTDTELLKKLFGVLLLYTGLREMLYRPRKPR